MPDVLFASLEGHLHFVLANSAFKSQHDFLCSFGLFMEHGLGLTTVSRLFAVVAAFALSYFRVLALLILCHLVRSILNGMGKKRLVSCYFMVCEESDGRVLFAGLALAIWCES
jgi:hypothetical protein